MFLTEKYENELINAIENETQEIDILMYIFGTNKKANTSAVARVLYALQTAKTRGVKIRAITDFRASAEMLVSAGIDARLATKARMHAKLFLFSEKAIIGSHNITDTALAKNTEASYIFTDFESLQEARKLFNRTWEQP